jgi:hypothetical protein
MVVLAACPIAVLVVTLGLRKRYSRTPGILSIVERLPPKTVRRIKSRSGVRAGRPGNNPISSPFAVVLRTGPLLERRCPRRGSRRASRHGHLATPLTAVPSALAIPGAAPRLTHALLLLVQRPLRGTAGVHRVPTHLATLQLCISPRHADLDMEHHADPFVHVR